MQLTRRRLLASTATTAATVGLAGCSGDGGGGSPSPDVQVRSHPELGDLLAGPDGMTLYVFDSDTRGEGASTCYGGCADSWPPLTVEDDPTAGSDVTADLTTFERDDGSLHVAANGWPLYYWAGDEDPGDATGQAVNDVWWVLDPSGTPVREGGGTATSDGGSA